MVSRRMTRRDLLAGTGSIVAGAAAAGLLAACGAGASGTTAGGQTATASVAATTASAAATAAQAPKPTASQAASTTAAKTVSASAASSVQAAPAGAVEFWQWGSGYVPGFAKLMKDFNDKHPDTPVNVTNPSDYWNKVVTTEASGTGPDMFLMNNVNFKQWAHNNSVADISSYLNTDKTTSANVAAMLQSGVDWYKYQGKTMGLPWDYSSGVVVFNVDLLKPAGLADPTTLGKDWDWNKLRDYATKLTQKSGSGTTRSGIWISNGLENGWYTFSVANGGSFFNATLDQCTIASEEAIAGLEFVVQMIKDGIAASPQFQDQANKANPQAGAVFINGATAMQLLGDWNFTSYEPAKNFNWNAGIFPYSPSTGKTANTSNLRGTVMNPASKNKDKSWPWLAYLTTKEVQDQIPTLLGEIPMNNASADANYLDPAKGGPPPGRTTLKPDLDSTTPLPSSDLISWSDIVKAAGGPVGDAFALKMPPADALKKVQETVTGIMQANKGK